jgi:hypothetical protein
VNGPTGPDGATKVLSENNLTLPLGNTGSTALLRGRQSRRSDFYPIAAASLGGIKSLVGIVEQCLAADQARNGYLCSRKPKAKGAVLLLTPISCHYLGLSEKVISYYC